MLNARSITVTATILIAFILRPAAGLAQRHRPAAQVEDDVSELEADVDKYLVPFLKRSTAASAGQGGRDPANKASAAFLSFDDSWLTWGDPLTGIKKEAEETDDSGFVDGGDGTMDCDVCARQFRDSGGCEASTDNLADYIPEGCGGSCGENAIKLCIETLEDAGHLAPIPVSNSTARPSDVFPKTLTADETTSLAPARAAVEDSGGAPDVVFTSIAPSVSSEGPGDERICKVCAGAFERANGCEAMLEGKDPSAYVPDGCDGCDEAMITRCQSWLPKASHNNVSVTTAAPQTDESVDTFSPIPRNATATEQTSPPGEVPYNETGVEGPPASEVPTNENMTGPMGGAPNDTSAKEVSYNRTDVDVPLASEVPALENATGPRGRALNDTSIEKVSYNKTDVDVPLASEVPAVENATGPRWRAQNDTSIEKVPRDGEVPLASEVPSSENATGPRQRTSNDTSTEEVPFASEAPTAKSAAGPMEVAPNGTRTKQAAPGPELSPQPPLAAEKNETNATKSMKTSARATGRDEDAKLSFPVKDGIELPSCTKTLGCTLADGDYDGVFSEEEPAVRFGCKTETCSDCHAQCCLCDCQFGSLACAKAQPTVRNTTDLPIANGTDALTPKAYVTTEKCACKKSWKGFAGPCDSYCCNPDADPRGDWCLVENKECQGNYWGYCDVQAVPTPETTPEPIADQAAILLFPVKDGLNLPFCERTSKCTEALGDYDGAVRFETGAVRDGCNSDTCSDCHEDCCECDCQFGSLACVKAERLSAEVFPHRPNELATAAGAGTSDFLGANATPNGTRASRVAQVEASASKDSSASDAAESPFPVKEGVELPMCEKTSGCTQDAGDYDGAFESEAAAKRHGCNGDTCVMGCHEQCCECDCEFGGLACVHAGVSTKEVTSSPASKNYSWPSKSTNSTGDTQATNSFPVKRGINLPMCTKTSGCTQDAGDYDGAYDFEAASVRLGCNASTCIDGCHDKCCECDCNFGGLACIVAGSLTEDQAGQLPRLPDLPAVPWATKTKTEKTSTSSNASNDDEKVALDPFPVKADKSLPICKKSLGCNQADGDYDGAYEQEANAVRSGCNADTCSDCHAQCCECDCQFGSLACIQEKRSKGPTHPNASANETSKSLLESRTKAPFSGAVDESLTELAGLLRRLPANRLTQLLGALQ